MGRRSIPSFRTFCGASLLLAKRNIQPITRKHTGSSRSKSNPPMKAKNQYSANGFDSVGAGNSPSRRLRRCGSQSGTLVRGRRWPDSFLPTTIPEVVSAIASRTFSVTFPKPDFAVVRLEFLGALQFKALSVWKEISVVLLSPLQRTTGRESLPFPTTALGHGGVVRAVFLSRYETRSFRGRRRFAPTSTRLDVRLPGRQSKPVRTPARTRI